MRYNAGGWLVRRYNSSAVMTVYSWNYQLKLSVLIRPVIFSPVTAQRRNLLTPCSTACLENLIVAQILNNFPVGLFLWKENFINTIPNARPEVSILGQINSIHVFPVFFFRLMLMLYSHLIPNIPSRLLFPVFPPNFFCTSPIWNIPVGVTSI
jgi:hypothetical protein